MPTSCDSLFEQALERYRNGAEASALLPDFEAITSQAPRQASGWICLAWLQLLTGDGEDALRSARTGVRLSPQDPQARINLALALLATGAAGVRDQIQVVQRILSMAPDLGTELRESIEDGLKRRPDWKELIKVKTWLDL
ncbi:hypothetical protein EVJ50_12410 [Synechococcus sp. RSCCF101]|uniref:tetratricopeptide repeat protein n=1 Tax=Synechococcus sp. RSCCF101 TaxID=2511069 RepID=UPI0012483FC6|nr:hypothetical protein [Synechococcus sp. RSCCF101]QEY32912.1 hypothetical protein EVJ50_12410 [Synechococcus sp. RSCCF101]